MEIEINKDLDIKKEVLILGLYKEDKDLPVKNKELEEELKEAIHNKNFDRERFGSLFAVKVSSFDYKHVLLVSLGPKKELTLEHLRRAMGKIVKKIKCHKHSSFTTDLAEKAAHLPQKDLGSAIAEGLLLADYSFDRYLSEERKEKIGKIKSVSFSWNKGQEFSAGLKQGQIIASSANYVRDLVNEPAAIATPEFMEHQAKELAKHHKNITVKVLDKAQLKKEGLNLLLGVGQGSVHDSRLILVEYKGSADSPIAFLGKGLTFDSGGYNLKPTKYIEEMKSDMAGSAAALGTIKMAAELGLKKHLLAVMPMAENMIGSRAQHPGDIIKGYNGKTVEIGNTDAEGRLVLADALAYTEKNYKPKMMIDMATLTGACVIALGYYAAGLISKNEQLANSLKSAGDKSGDRVWPLPFFEEYQDWMDGSLSDLNNISTKGKGYEAGSITAGVFLSKFVEKTPWAHLDIAGSAYWEVEGDYLDKGATGSGMRVLSYWLLEN